VLTGFFFGLIISILKPCRNSGDFRCVELATGSPLTTQITVAYLSGGNWEPDKLVSCGLGCHTFPPFLVPFLLPEDRKRCY